MDKNTTELSVTQERASCTSENQIESHLRTSNQICEGNALLSIEILAKDILKIESSLSILKKNEV